MQDRNEGKHYQIACRCLERGGRQDIYLGTRDCQGYVEPCEFGAGSGDYDGKGELGFGLMFHSFDYPDETGVDILRNNFWLPKMADGVVRFPRPEECVVKNEIRAMGSKRFGIGQNVRSAEAESAGLGV
jgi:CRISPR-associated protein Cas5d